MKRKNVSGESAEAVAAGAHAARLAGDGVAEAAADPLRQDSAVEGVAGKEADQGSADGAEDGASTRPAPALPWMRVPFAIEGSASVPLESVRGLQESLRDGLQDGADMQFRAYILIYFVSIHGDRQLCRLSSVPLLQLQWALHAPAAFSTSRRIYSLCSLRITPDDDLCTAQPVLRSSSRCKLRPGSSWRAAAARWARSGCASVRTFCVPSTRLLQGAGVIAPSVHRRMTSRVTFLPEVTCLRSGGHLLAAGARPVHQRPHRLGEDAGLCAAGAVVPRRVRCRRNGTAYYL